MLLVRSQESANTAKPGRIGANISLYLSSLLTTFNNRSGGRAVRNGYGCSGPFLTSFEGSTRQYAK